ncbi:hypothetical protein [Bosea sp. PAMC 26642]|uniref:hypothetical protein n=1 Tax=Bosea sp. (strain PAMC 26642) TaxID=1792307 RepID=UPI000770204C|nr:hypothetical protein [Bosea sp. PAMC 26642]AMJ61080.1 hypothetical protein AXW83_12975 [Bosea sp. PAMC 26642]
MNPRLAALLIPITIFLATHSEATSLTFNCKFDDGVVVINHSETTGRATVQIEGKERHYIVDNQKLVATQSGMPTYYFQSELKRWKRLNDRGETVETTVCKASDSSTAARSVSSLHN